jgi:hypothetical protein
MGFSVKPLVMFAQKRPETLDIDASIIPTPEAGDDVTDNKSTLMLLVTKYGLRLHVSHDATVEISYIHEHPPLLEKSVHDDVDGSNLPTLNAVAPLSNPPIPFTPISYYFVPSWGSSHLFMDGGFDVLKEEFEARYPRLVNIYFEWAKFYNDAFGRLWKLDQGSNPRSRVFPKVEDSLAWDTEGLLMACWLALQDNVQGVQYSSNSFFRKGHLEEEILRFLMDTENSYSKYIDQEYFPDSDSD